MCIGKTVVINGSDLDILDIHVEVAVALEKHDYFLLPLVAHILF